MSAPQGQVTTNAPPENGAHPRSDSRAGFNFDLPTAANSAPQDEITPTPPRATETNNAKRATFADEIQTAPARATGTHTAKKATLVEQIPQAKAQAEAKAQAQAQARGSEPFTAGKSTLVNQIPPAPARDTAAYTANRSTPVNQIPTATIANPPAVVSTPAPAQTTVCFSDQLNASDSTWKFKAILRFLLINLCIVGIGTLAYIMSQQGPTYYDFIDYGGYYFIEWPPLVTFSVSILWCTIYLLVLVSRRKATHPGLVVAFDLILWLAFIVTAAFAIASLIDLQSWGPDNNFGSEYSSNEGQYTLAVNGTVVWVPGSDDDSDYNSTRWCDQSNLDYYAGTSQFTNCADVDALVNKLWQSKPHRVDVLTAAVVCQFFGIIIHKILWIWACIDTHKYNRRKVGGDAEKMAANIVQTMINNGAIIPPQGRQSQGMYFQLPNQQSYPLIPVNTEIPPTNPRFDNNPPLPARPDSSSYYQPNQEAVAEGSGPPVQREVQEKGKAPRFA